jgi:hypothetical protein
MKNHYVFHQFSLSHLMQEETTLQEHRHFVFTLILFLDYFNTVTIILMVFYVCRIIVLSFMLQSSNIVYAICI